MTDSRLRLAAQAMADVWDKATMEFNSRDIAKAMSFPYYRQMFDACSALRRALAEHAEEPGVPTVDECERIAYKAGFREGVEAAVRRFYEGAAESHVAASVQSFLAALSHSAATGEQP